MRNTDINKLVEPRPKRAGGGSSGTTWLVVRKFFGAALKALLAVVMVGMITGLIVGVSVLIYIFSLSGTEANINMSAVKLSQTSFVFNTNAKGKVKEHVRLHGTENRVWVDLKNIPENMRNAFVAIEDERFYEHKGVDWKRTMAAAANLFIGYNETNFGASTITQQLIKNRTGDDDISLNRKITEIFKALNLEERFSKDEILESYLNVIALGNGCNGVQAAANTYFGKEVQDLSLAECASIAAITQNPSKYNPLRNPENNKKRQEDVLYLMKQNELITEAEYKEALDEKLVFKQKKKTEAAVPIWDYYVDLIIEDVIVDMMEEKDFSRQAAIDSVYNGGLKIYSAVDTKMQKILEDIFYDNEDCLPRDTSLQTATIVVDYKGRVLGTIGGRGKKPSNRCLNRSTQSKRQPGSSIKPLSAYAPAIEYNYAQWSTTYPNEMLSIKQGGRTISWPKNSDRTYSPSMTVQRAIQISSNCVAARVVQQMTPDRSYQFLTENLNFTSLVALRVDEKTGKHFSDINLSAFGTGGMTDGVTVREMSSGYMIFGNGGKFYKPYTYYEIKDYDNNVLIDNTNKKPIQAVSAGTASEMNKLLQTVVSGGTGRAAGLPGWTIFGKTGTTSDNKDRWFVGGTPLCVAAVWVGYDMPASINTGSGNPCIPVWNTIMRRYHEDMPKKNFDYQDIVTKSYCTVTGGASQSYCYSTAVGWFKRGTSLKPCNGDHSLDTSGGSGSSEPSSSESSGESSGESNSSKDRSDNSKEPSDKTPSSKKPRPPRPSSVESPSQPPPVTSSPPSSASSEPSTQEPSDE